MIRIMSFDANAPPEYYKNKTEIKVEVQKWHGWVCSIGTNGQLISRSEKTHRKENNLCLTLCKGLKIARNFDNLKTKNTRCVLQSGNVKVYRKDWKCISVNFVINRSWRFFQHRIKSLLRCTSRVWSLYVSGSSFSYRRFAFHSNDFDHSKNLSVSLLCPLSHLAMSGSSLDAYAM